MKEKQLNIQEVLESEFDMPEEINDRDNLGWALISSSWIIITG